MRLFRTDRRGNPIPWRHRKRNNRRAPHLPPLFTLVQNRAWNDVIRRSRTHRHEVWVAEEVSGNTALHVACRMGDPPEGVVEALLDAANMTNAEGATPLHLAAANRCSKQVMEVLLNNKTNNNNNNNNNVAPAAVLTDTGRAPIHYACMSYRGLRLDAFRVLLEATLKTGFVTPKIDDDYLLEDLIEDDEFDDEGDLLETEVVSPPAAPPPMVNVVTYRDASGQTPLGLLFRRYRERVRLVIQTMERWHREGRGTSRLAAALTIHADLGELWEKARCIVTRLAEEGLPRRLMVQPNIHPEDDDFLLFPPSVSSPISPAEQAITQEAARYALEQHGTTTTTTTTPLHHHTRRNRFRIVHASVSLTGFGCPPEMIRLAVSIHPDQVREMDDEGNLPLHIACKAPSLVSNSALLDDDSVSILSDLSFLSNTSATNSSTNTTSSPNAFDKVIQILLQQYPAAARIPHGQSGKLPLILAWDRRTWDDGIHTLLEAFPEALECRRKLPLSLYPLILRKMTRCITSKKRKISIKKTRALSSAFELIKAKPSLCARQA